MSTPSPAVIAPGADADMVIVKLTDGETLSVKYDDLMLSPVIRDAVHMQSLADKNPGGRGAVSGKIEINCDLGIAKLLFAILKGEAVYELYDTSKTVPLSDLATFLVSEDASIPSPVVLRRVLQVADFYDLHFFPRLVKAMLYDLIEYGNDAHSLSVAILASSDLEDETLAATAVNKISNLPIPVSFSRALVQAIGDDIWWKIVSAYSRLLLLGNAWDKLADPWGKLSTTFEIVSAPSCIVDLVNKFRELI